MGSKAGTEGRTDVFYYKLENLTVITDPEHPLYDPRWELPLNEGLVESVKKYGIQQPLIVFADGGKTVIKDGHQRYKAGVEANRRLLADGGIEINAPCIFKRGETAKLLDVGVLANAFRTDDPPSVRANRVAAFLESGRSEEEIGRLFGLTVQQVKRYAALGDLDPLLMTALDRGETTLKVAVELAAVSRDEQVAKFEELREAGLVRGEDSQAAAMDMRRELEAEAKGNGNGATPPNGKPAKKKRGAKPIKGKALTRWIDQLDERIEQLPGKAPERADMQLVKEVLEMVAGDSKAAVPKFLLPIAPEKKAKKKRRPKQVEMELSTSEASADA